MSKGNKLNSLTVSIIMAMVLSLSIVYAITTALKFTFPPFKILAFSTVMLMFYTAAFWNKLTRRIFLITATGINLILVIAMTAFKAGRLFAYVLVRRVQAFSGWFVEYNYGRTALVPEYETIASMVLCLVVTGLVYIFAVKTFKVFVVIGGGTALFALQWIFEHFVSYGAFYLFVFIAVAYYLRHIYIQKYNHNKEGDYFKPLQFAIFTVPLCAAVFALSYFVPSSSNPIEWKWMDDKVRSASGFFSNEYGSIFARLDFFSPEYTGFSGDNHLGGQIGIDTTQVLEVTAEKPAYLKAIAKDTYTGRAWLDTSETLIDAADSGSSLSMELQEVPVGLGLLSDGNINLRAIYTIEDYLVKFLGLKTKSMFIPDKTGDLVFPEGLGIEAKTNENSTIIMNKMMRREFNYRANSIFVDYDNRTLINQLNKSTKNFYRNIENGQKYSSYYRSNSVRNPLVVQWGQLGGMRFTEYVRYLADRAEDIYEKYTKLPDSLPDRVKKLADEITAGKRTNYEKVKAIEEYLSANFPYTLSPGGLPKDRDFVDYFLFDEKQGYCTYFASAMAVMVRSIGLPSRYVEGYAMPQEPVSENTYIVTNENAHAWVEVYFEGFGWMPFEPTPGGFQQVQETAAAVVEETVEPTPEPEADSADAAVEDDWEDAANIHIEKVYSIIWVLFLVIMIGSLGSPGFFGLSI